MFHLTRFGRGLAAQPNGSELERHAEARNTTAFAYSGGAVAGPVCSLGGIARQNMEFCGGCAEFGESARSRPGETFADGTAIRRLASGPETPNNLQGQKRYGDSEGPACAGPSGASNHG